MNMTEGSRRCTLAITFATAFSIGFVACSDGNKESQKPSSGIAMAGGSPVDADDIIAKATVALVELDKDARLAKGQFCTGTLLSREWILTAAHCVAEADVANIGVVFTPRDGTDGYGAENLRKVDRIVYRADNRLLEVCGDGQAIKGNEDECEARVEPKHPIHDIALLHIASSAPSSAVFARLPGALDLLPLGQDVVVAGYGMQGATSPGDGSLRKVTTVRITAEWAVSWEFLVRSTQEEGPCPGDSGGPLYRVNGQVLTVVGAVSRGPEGCGAKGIATAYSDLQKHRDWIGCQTNSNSKDYPSFVCGPLSKLTQTKK